MSSPRLIRPDNHPFPFLLYLEWALLGLAIVSELTPTLLPKTDGSPALVVVCVLGFGGLGLWLPTRPRLLQLGHLVAQFGLIFLASRLGLAGLRLFPLLFVVLVTRSCLMVGRWGQLMVTGTTFVLFVGMMQSQVQGFNRQLPLRLGRRILPQLVGIGLNLVLLFAIALIFVLLLVNALLAERARREELRLANEKLRESAVRIEQLAMAQERSRIAREIHDALGHSLTGLNIQLEGALKLWEGNPERARQFVAQAKAMGSTALQEVRQAVATLRDAPITGPDLQTAIATLTQQFRQMTGITPTVVLNCPPLPQSLQVTTYRIVQEALTNICKYAQATAVEIRIQRSPAPRPGLSISVQDNGIGFRPDDNPTGFGLQGMQERATAEGGQFQLVSAPGAGCTIQVWLPLSAEDL